MREVLPLALQSTASLNGAAAQLPAAPNLKGRFPAVILQTGKPTDDLGVRAVLTSLSATDFCMQLHHSVDKGDKLMVITQLSHAIVLLRGEVVGVEQHEQGSDCCLRIQQHQLFSLAAAEVA